MKKKNRQVINKCHFCLRWGCELFDWTDETCKSRHGDSCSVCGASSSHNHELCSKCIGKADLKKQKKLNHDK